MQTETVTVDWNGEDLDLDAVWHKENGRTHVSLLRARLRGKVNIYRALTEREVEDLERSFADEIDSAETA